MSKLAAVAPRMKTPPRRCRLVWLAIKLPDIKDQPITGPPSEVFVMRSGKFDRRGYEYEELMFTCLN